MISLFFWYMLGAGVLLGLAILSLIQHRALRISLCTILFLSGLVLTYTGIFSLTGKPQPVWLMLSRPVLKEAELVGVDIQEDKGIYLLLKAAELGPIPQYFWFPYSTKAAEQIQKSMREAERQREGKDSKMMIDEPFEKSLETRDDGFIHAKPQPKGPDKPYQEPERMQLPKPDSRF